MAWKHGLVLSLVLTAAAPTLVAQARADVALTLRLAGEPRSFYPGELIPIELEFTSPFRKRFVVYDNWGARRDLTDEFRVDPDRGVSDPLLDFLALGSCMDCGFGIYSLDGEPMVRKLDLNEWFRFDEPGTYRVSLLSKSVHRDESLVVPVESNTITVEILPRDERWEAEHVAALIARVDQRRSFERLECRGLQFLGTHAAVDAMIRRFDDPDCQSEFVRGLFGAPDREYVVRQMAGWISAPDQSVSQYYLRILALLSVYLDHPEFRPAQTALTKGRPAARGALSDNRSLIDAAIERFQAAAVATRGNKDPRARAITIESAFQAMRPGPEREALRADVIATFLDLPTDRQRSVLEHHWSSFNVPAMLPVLRRLSATPVPDDGYAEGALVDLALRRWWQLAPAEARPAILEHIAKPGPGDTIGTLGALPDRTLPSLDAALAAHLLATDDESRSLAVSLFERYATGAVEGAGGQAFDAALKDEDCEAAAGIVAYLARVDAAQSRVAISRMRSAAQGGCRFLWLDLQSSECRRRSRRRRLGRSPALIRRTVPWRRVCLRRPDPPPAGSPCSRRWSDGTVSGRITWTNAPVPTHRNWSSKVR
jgi:hypothetical protein